VRSTRPAEAIRVLVADGNAIESELLARAIGRDRRFIVVGSSVKSADLHDLASERCPDVLLVTPSLEDAPNAGLDVLADFRTSYPRLKTVVLLESSEPDLVVQAFRLGAQGVFSKNLPVKILAKCIERVQEGQIWATNQEVGFVLEALAVARAVRTPNSELNKLSVRELEIINLLAEGLSNREMARRLGLSTHTVRNYMVNIFHKLGTSSRFELLFHALRCPSSKRWIPSETERVA
jgi:two-component system, NarL family, nitrate/nitrite response regulator NarL